MERAPEARAATCWKNKEIQTYSTPHCCAFCPKTTNLDNNSPGCMNEKSHKAHGAELSEEQRRPHPNRPDPDPTANPDGMLGGFCSNLAMTIRASAVVFVRGHL